MSRASEPPLRDFMFGGGYGGAARDRSEVPLVRGRDDPALIVAAQSGLSGFAARTVVDPPPKAAEESSWPRRTAAPARIERVEPPMQRPRFNAAYAWGGNAVEDMS